jgi:hypothetical protein
VAAACARQVLLGSVCRWCEHRPNSLFSINHGFARQAMLARQNESEVIDYWLIATPLKEATPIEPEVAKGVRSPWPSMAKTAT